MRNEDWKNEVIRFLQTHGIKFYNIDLYTEALTHSSYSYSISGIESNERLEFLGDSILGKEISEYLFDTRSSGEGELSIIKSTYVDNNNLQRISREMGIERILRIGNGTYNISDKMIGDALEALIGALYKDSEEECKKFIRKYILSL